MKKAALVILFIILGFSYFLFPCGKRGRDAVRDVKNTPHNEEHSDSFSFTELLSSLTFAERGKSELFRERMLESYREAEISKGDLLLSICRADEKDFANEEERSESLKSLFALKECFKSSIVESEKRIAEAEAKGNRSEDELFEGREALAEMKKGEKNLESKIEMIMQQ